MSRAGSSVVLVLCVISAITILMTVMLRTSIFGHDLSLKRVECEKQFWVCNAYEQYAVAYLNSHSLEIIKSNSAISLSPVLLHNYQGAIQLTPNKNNIDVSVQLNDNNENLQRVMFTYRFALDDDGKQSQISISNWRLE
ncbi:MAG: hypothetical protein P4L31_03940 [Candidatus Babeliales bacterium]|nr:hypothetical protein [Candidatus Babeliales bacterium]